MKNRNFLVIAPLPSLSRRTRLFKLCKFITGRSQTEIRHWAWERTPGEAVEPYFENIDKKVILRGGGYGGKVTRAMYPLWMLVVFFRSFFIKKETIVWALGFESAFPLILAKRIRGFQLFFDDADRFSMILRNSELRRVVAKLEERTSRAVDYHVVPSAARYDFRSSTFFEMANCPSKSELDSARDLYDARGRSPSNGVTLYANGWLGAGRGMDTLLQVFRLLEGAGVRLLMAGKLDCSTARLLAEMDNVTHLGELSNAEALSWYFASDLVYTFYDPAIEINRFAESNKWGDAVKTGVGILVNKEIKAARHIVEGGYGVALGYADVQGIAEMLRSLAASPDRLYSMKSAANLASKKMGFYEDRLDQLFSRIDSIN